MDTHQSSQPPSPNQIADAKLLWQQVMQTANLKDDPPERSFEKIANLVPDIRRFLTTETVQFADSPNTARTHRV